MSLVIFVSLVFNTRAADYTSWLSLKPSSLCEVLPQNTITTLPPSSLPALKSGGFVCLLGLKTKALSVFYFRIYNALHTDNA